MDKRQILTLLKIGGIDVSNKCVDAVTVDRNFSDVGDKFSIDIVDTPDTSIMYDLELYMASGYRSIILKYGDISENQLVSFKGTIWDYTNTFVGNIKKLTITGIMNRYTYSTDGAAEYTYNIDWNSYFNVREDESQTYDAISAMLIRDDLIRNYTERKETLTKHYKAYLEYDGETIDYTTFRASDILNAEYKNALNSNSKKLKIKGPVGEIYLPIPDSFITLNSSQIPPGWPYEYEGYGGDKTVDEYDYKQFLDVIYNRNKQFWDDYLRADSNVVKEKGIVINYPSPYKAEGFYMDEDYEMDASTYDTPSGKIINFGDYDFLNNVIAMRIPQFKGTIGRVYVREDFLDKALDKYYDCDGWHSEDTMAKAIWGTIKTPNAQHKDSDNVITWTVENTKNQIIGFMFEWANEPLFRQDGLPTSLPDGDFVSKRFIVVPDELLEARTREYALVNDFGFQLYLFKDTKYYTYKNTLQNDTGGNYYLYQEENVFSRAKNLVNRALNNAESPRILRGFIINNTDTGDRNLYVQANRKAQKSIFGAAGLVASGIGVNISDIVEKLAILEGWKLRRDNEGNAIDIVQTELVPNSDALIMQGQSAMDFIINNLVPRSVTPIGKYYALNKDTGKMEWTRITQPQGGFYPFFDENGYFHYQPITEGTIKKLNIDNLGYNIPGSPMISFQINTKGTAFYTNNNIDYNPISLVTGMQVDSIELASSAEVDQIEQTRGHNDTFDAWLGLTYNDVENKVAEDASADSKYDTALTLAQNALVTPPNSFLMNSAGYDITDIEGNILLAKDKIEKTTIKATLSMWGNTEVAPARSIEVLNMVKGGEGNSATPQRHPSSGEYMILSQQDRISASGFIQNLNLLRYSKDVREGINKYKIDYSQRAQYEYDINSSTDTKNSYYGVGNGWFGDFMMWLGELSGTDVRR